MVTRKCFVVCVFLVFVLALSGLLFGQRVINLDKVWGDMRVLGDDVNGYSGQAVAYGDINGDGFMDIIIGAYTASPGGSPLAGETYVIFGSGSPISTIDLSTQSADITVCGAAAGDKSGTAVACGDVNGDGYDDLIIGATFANPGGRTWAGETYVIFGSSFPEPPYTIDLSTEQADITVCGDDAEDHSGYPVASGDVNGDGCDDIIIGAATADPGGRENAGETYVIFGSGSPPSSIDLSTASADITICGDDAWDISGWALSNGDVNGDSYDDIIIGARWSDPGDPVCIEAGETYVIFGSGSPPPYTIDLSTDQADITVYGDDPGDNSGAAVAIGDVNGDGYGDIIIGAPLADAAYRTDVGATYVIFGSHLLIPPVTIYLDIQPADFTIYGDDALEESGCAVARGDVNADGYDDIIIGAHYADPGGRNDAGKTDVIFGFSPFFPVTIDLSQEQADIAICGDDAEDQSGTAIASGDVNGDGYDDLIIGAPFADPGGRNDAGETYLISGGGAFITAHGLGGKSWIKEFSLLANSWNTFKAFGAVNSQGEVHIAVGDVDGDSLDEIAAGQGEGAKSWVKFFEVDGTFISTFKAFGASNTNGELHLALGNFDADTADNEIAIAQGEGGQSWVKLFEIDGTFIRSIKAFGAANAQGEVHVASGDLNKDGIDEIIVGMGEGGSSWVKVFNLWGDLVRSFKAFTQTENPGGEVRLAVGNFDADPAVEIAVATGYNGGNKVKLFEKEGTFISQFDVFLLGGNPNGDVHIAAADIDNDGVDEILCAHGEGGSSSVHVCKVDGTIIMSFKAFGAVNTQGEVHLGSSKY